MIKRHMKIDLAPQDEMYHNNKDGDAFNFKSYL